MMNIKAGLLADTKLAENISQHVVSGDLTCDFTQVMKDHADVHGHEIGCDAVGQSMDNPVGGFLGFDQGLVMTRVGHDHTRGIVASFSDGSEQHLG
jgi:hypothetical protein